MAIHSPLDDPPQQIFLDHLPRIERAARHACRRVLLQSQEVEDFVSCVRLKLIDNDYEVIRKYKGISKLETYLVTCVRNFFKDYLNHLWGKWRPSKEADRLGPVAVALEKLFRDGLTLHEAIETLITNHHVEMSRQELEDLATLLPPRPPQKQHEGEEPLVQKPAPGKHPEGILIDKEREERRRRMIEALARAWKTLSPEDRLILRMKNDEGLQVSMIARILKTEQGPLYRRLDKTYKILREFLEREGFDPEDIL